MNQSPSSPVSQRRRNGALWTGSLLTLLGIGSNFLYFLNLPGQALFPWLSLLLPAIALLFFFVGIKRAFGQPQIFRGKVAGIVLTVIALPLFVLSTWGFFHSREVPASSHAPQVGQKAPDFTLSDIHGQPVSLSQLLTTPAGGTNKAPKAVLLIFYRGWW